MAWFSRIFRGRSKGAEETGDIVSTTQPGWMISALGGGPTATGINVNPTTALSCATVFACCRVLAEDMGKLPFGVFQERADGGKEDAAGDPLWPLLKKPNGWQTRNTFIERIMYSMLLEGDAFIVILRDGNGWPRQLVPVNPRQVTIMVDPEGGLWYQVARTTPHDQAVMRGNPMTLPASEVIHIPLLVASGLRGMSPISAAREAIGLALAAETYGAKLFGQGARPSGAITHPTKMTPQAYEEFKTRWNNSFSGVDNAGRTVILEDGMTYKTMSMSSVDAEWLASRKFSVEDIARMYRVPLHMIQHVDKQTSWGSGIHEQTRTYYDQALMPYCERIESAFDDKFTLSEKKRFTQFDTKALLRADVKTRFEIYAKGRQWTIFTPNECRLDEGMNPVGAEGDLLMVPVNMMPLDKWKEGGWKDVSSSKPNPETP